MSEMENKPASSVDLIQSIWAGLIKAAMKSQYETHDFESKLKVQRKPDLRVIAEQGFKKNQLRLYPLSRNVGFMTVKEVAQPDLPDKAFKAAHCYDNDTGAVIAYVKRDLVFPELPVTTGTARVHTTVSNVVAFWAVGQSVDPSKANLEKEIKTVSVKVGATSYSIEIAMYVSKVEISKGDRLVVLKTAASQDDDEQEPSAKRQKKGDDSKGNGKGGGKGKAGKRKK